MRTISDASLRCHEVLGTTLLHSSRDVGWKSLLIDHDRIVRAADEVETHPTPDQTLIIMLRGKQEIAVRNNGRGAAPFTGQERWT